MQMDVVVEKQGHTEQEGVHRSPAEPPERAQQQRGIHFRFQLLVQATLERNVHQIEKVEMAEPDDAENDVAPAEHEVDERGAAE
ncbi:MAG: hypothetical protein ABUS79_23785, partial [Pseudomonadota bacterium]